jgi:hypothetical protein
MAKGKLLEEPGIKTKLKPKRTCRAGWMDHPKEAILLPQHVAYVVPCPCPSTPVRAAGNNTTRHDGGAREAADVHVSTSLEAGWEPAVL